MRILHTADLHLGRQFNGLSLEDDHQTILNQIFEAIIEHNPDVLIIAGDVYDRPSPSSNAVNQFNNFLNKIRENTSTIVIMIAGNHDSADRIETMSVFADKKRALIRGKLNASETPLILNDDHGAVAFSALPFGYEYAARECFRDVNIASPEDVLRAQVAAARENIPTDARWVIVAHAFVVGGSISEVERNLTRAGGVEAVRAEIFDGAHYVALGHLHRPQRVGAEHIRYSGAPLAYGFDEAGDAKSMTFVDMDETGKVNIDIIPFRPIRSVRVLRGLLSDLLKEPLSSDIMKAILSDKTPQIDAMSRLRKIFPNACQLTYESMERALEFKSAIQDQERTNEPMQIIADFISQVREHAPYLSPDEVELINSQLEALSHEENAA